VSSAGRNVHANAKPKPILRHWQAAYAQSDHRAGGSPRRIGKQGDPGDDRIECERRKHNPAERTNPRSTPVLTEIQHHDRATVPRWTHSLINQMHEPVRQP
jgi:hypothetical protein